MVIWSWNCLAHQHGLSAVCTENLASMQETKSVNVVV